MTNCPRCYQPLDISTALIPGAVVLACRKTCRIFAVAPPEGIDWEWLEGGPRILERLIASREAARQMAAIMQSDDDDPRWETMGGGG